MSDIDEHDERHRLLQHLRATAFSTHCAEELMRLVDNSRVTLAQLRSDLARVTQERDEALREVQRKGAREIGLLSRALAAETQSDITQDALTAMRQERDALSAQLTTAVRDARATAAGDIQRAEAERDAALSDLERVTRERDEAEARYERLTVQVNEDHALRFAAVRVVMDERDADLTAMRHRAERAEAELATHKQAVTDKMHAVMCATVEPPDDTAECIAAWLWGRAKAEASRVDSYSTTQACAIADERAEVCRDLAADIRAGAWKKETT
jgi:chromosome segregation ATPase